jgi:hypothetical protein
MSGICIHEAVHCFVQQNGQGFNRHGGSKKWNISKKRQIVFGFRLGDAILKRCK